MAAAVTHPPRPRRRGRSPEVRQAPPPHPRPLATPSNRPLIGPFPRPRPAHCPNEPPVTLRSSGSPAGSRVFSLLPVAFAGAGSRGAPCWCADAGHPASRSCGRPFAARLWAVGREERRAERCAARAAGPQCPCVPPVRPVQWPRDPPSASAGRPARTPPAHGPQVSRALRVCDVCVDTYFRLGSFFRDFILTSVRHSRHRPRAPGCFLRLIKILISSEVGR